ncbi:hypothetical protein FQV39_13460 [Bosea sp. F3-2]|uniref:hypothetical protein n=1 Tax=Bosea sp. F3-2 TaxID=2599640 RepID=UPI0011EDDA3C|nr:hypothetical protein [Bosea sp. F3-2]QEL23471.1 hypothetical protein FQV39_13460 [Bosea sp. F3-2]
MRKSIATVSSSDALIEKLKAIASVDFDDVEVFESAPLPHARSMRDIRSYATDRGLLTDLLQPFRDVEDVFGAQHKRNLTRTARKFDLMDELDRRKGFAQGRSS